MKKNYILLILPIVMTTFSQTSYSETKATQKAAPVQESVSANTAAPAQNEAEELDINKLKENYWKPKDGEQEVVQNKLFTKEKKLEVSPMFGVYLRVDFQDAKTIGGSTAYHFNDFIGLEATYLKIKPKDARVLEKLKETRGASIEFNEEKSFVGFAIPITPMYAKFQFLGKKIGHFDVYVAPGFGMMKTVANRFALTGAIGQRYFITTWMFLKLEYKFIHYNDKVDTKEGATAIKNGGPGYYNDSVSDHLFNVGISFLLF